MDWKKRIESDPELQEIFAEDPREYLIERLKQHHRAEKARAAREAARRARLRRVTFGLLGR